MNLHVDCFVPSIPASAPSSVQRRLDARQPEQRKVQKRSTHRNSAELPPVSNPRCHSTAAHLNMTMALQRAQSDSNGQCRTHAMHSPLHGDIALNHLTQRKRYAHSNSQHAWRTPSGFNESDAHCVTVQRNTTKTQTIHNEPIAVWSHFASPCLPPRLRQRRIQGARSTTETRPVFSCMCPCGSVLLPSSLVQCMCRERLNFKRHKPKNRGPQLGVELTELVLRNRGNTYGFIKVLCVGVAVLLLGGRSC